MTSEEVLREELMSCRELISRLTKTPSLSKHWKNACLDELDKIDEAFEKSTELSHASP